MTDNHQYLDALQEERRGYEIRGLSDRLKQVDAEIARVKRAAGVADVAESPVDVSSKPSRVTRRKVG